MEANPFDVTFHWKFNKSLNAMEFVDIPSSHVAVDRVKATAHYTPLTEHVSVLFFCTENLFKLRNVTIYRSPLAMFTIYVFFIFRVIKFNKILYTLEETQYANKLKYWNLFLGLWYPFVLGFEWNWHTNGALCVQHYSSRYVHYAYISANKVNQGRVAIFSE